MDEPQISVLEVIRKLGIVPIYGWEVRFDHKYKIKCRPFTVPRASQMSDILGMSFRLVIKHTIVF